MSRQLASFGLCALAFATASSISATSQAQEFYRAGQVSVAVERVFGIHYVHNSYDGPGPYSQSESATSIGIGWQGSLSPLHWARAAVDGFIIDQLSLGGSLGFFTQSGDAHADGFLFSPRVGYAIPLSKVFTFWPRGGFTFVKVEDASLFGLTAEAMFVASPRPGWGILFGPTIDLSFTGDAGGNRDWSQFALGFPTVGLMATF